MVALLTAHKGHGAHHCRAARCCRVPNGGLGRTRTTVGCTRARLEMPTGSFRTRDNRAFLATTSEVVLHRIGGARARCQIGTIDTDKYPHAVVVDSARDAAVRVYDSECRCVPGGAATRSSRGAGTGGGARGARDQGREGQALEVGAQPQAEIARKCDVGVNQGQDRRIIAARIGVPVDIAASAYCASDLGVRAWIRVAQIRQTHRAGFGVVGWLTRSRVVAARC
jgi:hypothetical protein